MTTANTNLVSLYVSPEAAWGEAIGTSALAPKMYEMRMTGETLAHKKMTVQSETIRGDRMRDFIAEVGASADGDINYEGIFSAFDLLLENAFSNNWSYIIEKTFGAGVIAAVASGGKMSDSVTAGFTGFMVGAEVWASGFLTNAANNGRFLVSGVNNGAGTTALTLTGNTLVNETPAGAVTLKSNKASFTDIAIASASTISSTTTDFTSDVKLVVGQWVMLGGFTNPANNVAVQIVTVAAHLLTVSGATLVTESAATRSLSSKRLKNGVIPKSLLARKYFSDINQYVYLQGLRASTSKLSFDSQKIVTMTTSFMGKGAVAGTDPAGTLSLADANDPINTTTNLGLISEGGSVLTTPVKSMELTINNNLRDKPQLSSKYPTDIGYGFSDVQGSLVAYFSDIALYNKFLNHTKTSITWRSTDNQGNVTVYTIPSVYYTDGNPTTPAGNQDVMVTMNFQVTRDPVLNANLIVDCLAA